LELEAYCLGLDALLFGTCQAWSLTLGTWIFYSLALVAYSFFFSEYWSMGSGHFGQIFYLGYDACTSRCRS
jgi:hypothetical protein